MPPEPSSSPREQRLTEGVIAHLPLFAGVSPREASLLASRCWVVRAARGELIVRHGTRMPGVFALAYGSVKLVLRSSAREQRLLRLIAAGQSFGEAHALLGRASDYDALALAESKLVVVPCESLLALAERDARFARNMMMTLAQRWVDLLGAYEAATLQKSAQRLASYLASLAGTNGSPGPTVISLPVSKTTIAAQLGVKKETLSRLLRQFAARGLIEVSRREVAILDRAALAATAAAN